MNHAISLRPLSADDTVLVHHWLNREPVRSLYARGPVTRDRVEAKYLPRIRREEPVAVYVFSVETQDAGLIEMYLLADFPEYRIALQGEPDWAALDFFIGEAAFRGIGLAKQVLRRFVAELIFAAGHSTCCSSPLASNERSIRALAGAGFRKVRLVKGPDGQAECPMVSVSAPN